MTAKTLLELPEAFEQYRPLIEGTMKPVVLVNTEISKTTLFQSKFAGDPYFPLGMDYQKHEGTTVKAISSN